MKKRVLIILITLGILLLVGFLIIKLYQPKERAEDYCRFDRDCITFGQDGDCNCGCYTEATLPTDSGGKCYCAAPTSCKCVNHKCEGVFE